MLNKIIHNSAKNITPPIIWKILQNSKKKYGFFGNFSDWEKAKKLSGGYDSDLIIEKVKNSALKVKNGEAAYERDSVLFDNVEYSWPLLAALLWIAAKNNNQLNLIDFGGALGTSYYQNQNFLKHLDKLNWNIVEQTKFVEYGQKLFADDNLKFYGTIEACLKNHAADTLILSSVLQYLEDPYEFLKQSKKFKYIIVDRTPMFEENDRIVVQKVPRKIYEASYPCRILNRKKLIDFFTINLDFKLIAEFDAYIGTVIDLKDCQATYKGFIFKKNNI